MCHELDNYARKRLFRIEYKRPGEKVPTGQAKHFRALLESVRPDWALLFVLVLDEGQCDMKQIVRFGWRSSTAPNTVKFEVVAEDTINNLGARIAAWLWCER